MFYVVWYKFTDVSEVLAASIIRVLSKELTLRISLMIEAASTCETSVNFYHTTRRSIPEDIHLHTPRLGNLKFHITFFVL
jgi:hypothetical protein